MADNFNINLDQAAQGAKDVDAIGPAVANNAATMMQQQQLVAQAIQKSKQAQMSTQEQADELSSGGYLSEHGQVPKAQAITELKTMLTKDGEDQDTIDKAVQDAEDTWPDVVNAYDIRGFISALKGNRPVKMAEGQPYQATGSEKDASGNAIPKGTWIQESVDDDGNSTIVHSAQPASIQNHAGAAGAGDDKQWQKLDGELNKFIRSSRGNSLIQAVQRADRAINELNAQEVLTPQVLSYVQKDISGIFQGGVPPVAGADAEDFTTVYQKLNGLIQKYTGVSGWLHTDLGNQKATLLALLGRLQQSTLALLKAAISSEAAGYQNIINNDPARWRDMVDQKMGAVTAGVNPAPGSASPAPAAGNPGSSAPAANQNDPLGIL